MNSGCVDLRAAKAAVIQNFSPTQPGRMLLQSLPDNLPSLEFDIVALAIIRALRTRIEER